MIVNVTHEEGGPAASRWRSATHPFLYEINTWPWLNRLSTDTGRRIDLGSVPDEHWDAIADLGFDAVWLMGVWERSPAGVTIALADGELVSAFEATLDDYTPSDVVGSPYCIRDYEVDSNLGGRAGLAAARAALARRGLGLILDFVPNHVAPDHPWTTTHPERFVQGTAADLRHDATSFVDVAGRVLANGRDPYFPAWPDVVQLNAFSPDLRSAVVDTLRRIAEQCDGVRCDMAMLMMNDTFGRTWGARAGDAPADDYWPTVIPAVRESHPTFHFIAEAYWDLEWALQQQGFDFCYDKRLYDRLVQGDAEQVGGHLLADRDYQQKLVRFIENHDEPRAATVFDPARENAAAVATLTQTGARLVHDGQMEGRRARLPVFLGRFPTEPVDTDRSLFYRSLLTTLGDNTFRTGVWQLCDRSGSPGNDRTEDLVAWCWDGDRRWLVVVNLGPDTAIGYVRVPWHDLRGVPCRLVDPTHDAVFDRAGTDLCDGLYVELGPWQWHLFRIDSAEEHT
ncbi:alpha-amylase family glycosyl hydrolase [Rhodococcus koreensis]|uniref:alpha-amylase family glycosyl hydrolase n=1 Tax=Rhodococcus koreensis TaxID=99653 RepID=UPI0036DD7991